MKNLRLRQFYVFFSSIFIFMIHLPFTFARSMSSNEAAKPVEHKNTSATAKASFSMYNSVYDSLKLNILGLSKQAFEYAVQGLDKLTSVGKIMNDKIISIADMSLPSTEKRLFVIDLSNQKLLFNTYVAHGMGSGKEFAQNFSNKPESYKSSLGFYETTETYFGKHGYSMKLDGLEQGINDRANERAIVMHSAPYVSEKFIKNHGFLGRSHGCPAVPEKLNKPIIEKIKNGTCLFIYGSDKKYLSQSRILNS
jgi:hypothetical protein